MAHVLIVEDDGPTRDLLATMLRRRGHRVEIAADGFEALEMVRSHAFDVILLDYHLPDVDGFACARLMERARQGLAPPRLLAVTGDPDSVSARAGSVALFDAIVPKPIDARRLVAAVESGAPDARRAQAQAGSRALWRQRGLPDRPRALPCPAPTREQALALDLCFAPASSPDAADLILLLDPAGTEAASRERMVAPEGHLVPIVDMTGACQGACDGVFRINEPDSWTDLAFLLRRFAQQRASLSAAARNAADQDTRLLAYLHVCGRALEPVRTPSEPRYFRYFGLFDTRQVEASAERLARDGLLVRRFADRFHACRACGSHRLNVREECPACRSANLAETALIHHFKCAHLGPEEDFRSGYHLTCPKCRMALRHYGSDYERAGSALRCRTCRAVNSEAAVGFSCVDCGHHMDGDVAPTRDVHAYELTQRAVALVTGAGPGVASPARIPEIEATSSATGPAPPDAEGVTVVEIRYGAREGLAHRRGEVAFAKLRSLFLENLGNLLAEVGQVVPSEDVDYLVLRDLSADEFTRAAGRIAAQCEATLAEPLAPEFRTLAHPRVAA